jgi:dihydrofolate reductase
LVFNDIDQALEACQQYDEIFVIGGATFYEVMLPKANSLYLTQIDKVFAGDTFFPKIDGGQWKEVAREDIKGDDSVDFSYSFIKLEKQSFG